jgi:hypothetical protein
MACDAAARFDKISGGWGATANECKSRRDGRTDFLLWTLAAATAWSWRNTSILSRRILDRHASDWCRAAVKLACFATACTLRNGLAWRTAITARDYSSMEVTSYGGARLLLPWSSPSRRWTTTSMPDLEVTVILNLEVESSN